MYHYWCATGVPPFTAYLPRQSIYLLLDLMQWCWCLRFVPPPERQQHLFVVQHEEIYEDSAPNAVSLFFRRGRLIAESSVLSRRLSQKLTESATQRFSVAFESIRLVEGHLLIRPPLLWILVPVVYSCQNLILGFIESWRVHVTLWPTLP